MGQELEPETVSAAEVGSFESLCDKVARGPSACREGGSGSDADTGTATSPCESRGTAPCSSERSSCPSQGQTSELVALEVIDVPDDLNGRLETDPDAVDRLARQIEACGLLHPVTLRRMGTRYELIAGRHRLRAFEKLRRPMIAAVVLDVSALEAGTIRLAENVARSKLSAVEEAKQLAPLVTEHPDGVEGVARDIGRRVEWILDRIDMCEWPGELLEHCHCGRISLGAAQRLARIEPEGLRSERIRFAALHGINVKTAALWLSESVGSAAADVAAAATPEVPGAGQYQTETLARCFGCAEMAPLAETMAVRVCNDCLVMIQTARSRGEHVAIETKAADSSAPPGAAVPTVAAPPSHRDQSPMLTPAVYDPPPRGVVGQA